MAARLGKSMNAEVVTALEHHITRDGEPSKDEIRTALDELRQEIKELRKALGRGILDEKVDAIMRRARIRTDRRPRAPEAKKPTGLTGADTRRTCVSDRPLVSETWDTAWPMISKP